MFEYAHRFPVCRIRRLKGCPNVSASTAWDYTGLVCNLYRDAGPKCCHDSQTSCAQSPQPLLHMVQHVADWVWIFNHSHVELRAIIIIIRNVISLIIFQI